MAYFPITANENDNILVESKGDVIKISVTENDIADVITAGFDRLVVERSVDDSVWAEITTAPTRPALEAGKTDYEWRDKSGSTSYYYRIRYINSSTGDLTQGSESTLGSGLAIRNILTVPDLKNRYLFGLDTTDDAGVEMSDSVYEHYILSAIRTLEMELDIPVLPTAFVEKYDYYLADHLNWSSIYLDHYPVVELTSVTAQYPLGQTVVEFPSDWWSLDQRVGHLRLVPTTGSLSQVLVGVSGSYLPAAFTGMDHIPQFWSISYTAGFQEGRVPRNLVDLIGKLASLGPFNIFGDLIAGAGIANLSLSMDGLSQTIGTTSSATNAGYGARIIQYTKEIKAQIPLIRAHFKRPGGMVVA